MTRWILLGLWLVLVACTRKPPSPPFPDSGDGGLATCPAACANLRALGCQEGAGVTGDDASVSCEEVCQHAVDVDIAPFDLACISGAKSKDSVRACAGMSGDCP